MRSYSRDNENEPLSNNALFAIFFLKKKKITNVILVSVNDANLLLSVSSAEENLLIYFLFNTT